MPYTLKVIQINIYPFDNLNMVNAKKLKKKPITVYLNS